MNHLDAEQELRLYESIAALDAVLPAPTSRTRRRTANSLYRVLRRATTGARRTTPEYRSLRRAMPAEHRPELYATLALVRHGGGYNTLLRWWHNTREYRPSS